MGEVATRQRDGEIDLVRLYLDDVLKAPLLTGPEEVELAGEIRTGSEVWERALKEGRALTIEEEEHFTKGINSYRKFFRSNLPLVIRIATRYSDNDRQLLHNISEGNMGLAAAIDNFDATRGNKFSTLAYPHIKGAIKRAKNTATSVRISDENRRGITTYLQYLGRGEEDESIMQDTGWSIARLQRIKEAYIKRFVGSLQDRTGPDDKSEVAEVLPDEGVPVEAVGIMNADAEMVLGGILKVAAVYLSERDFAIYQEIITKGLLRIPEGYEKLAQKYGTSTETPKEIKRVMQSIILHPVNQLAALRSDDFEWQLSADCVPYGMEIFFPPRGSNAPLELAKRVCAECVVSEQCELLAESEAVRVGIWNGKSIKQRREERSAAKAEQEAQLVTAV